MPPLQTPTYRPRVHDPPPPHPHFLPKSRETPKSSLPVLPPNPNPTLPPLPTVAASPCVPPPRHFTTSPHHREDSSRLSRTRPSSSPSRRMVPAISLSARCRQSRRPRSPPRHRPLPRRYPPVAPESEAAPPSRRSARIQGEGLGHPDRFCAAGNSSSPLPAHLDQPLY
jgi:hypothetical protein